MSARTRTDANAARTDTVSRSRKIGPIVCGLVVLAGSGALYGATGARTADRAVSEALAGLRSSWTKPLSNQRASVEAAVATPVLFNSAASAGPSAGTGDEGFWLSSRTLSGMSQQALAIGDPMTIGERHFHVTELTPLAAPAGAAVAGKTGHQLMLVVATEVGDETAKPAPRRLRFLIEGIAPAVSAPASTGTAGGSQGTL